MPAKPALCKARMPGSAPSYSERTGASARRTRHPGGWAIVRIRGTDPIILGCMSMYFFNSALRISKDLAIQVINPTRGALQAFELWASLELMQSPPCICEAPGGLAQPGAEGVV